MENEVIEEALRACEFFKELSQNDIEKIVSMCWMRSFEIGEFVFQQGDFGEHLFVIADGQVVLEREINLGMRKGSVPIGVYGRGRVLGCWSTLLDQPHTLMASAVCQKSSRLIVMKGMELRNLMVENKDFGFNVMEKFCFLLKDRIQAAYGAMEKL